MRETNESPEFHMAINQYILVPSTTTTWITYEARWLRMTPEGFLVS